MLYETRNAWQILPYSPLDDVVSPLANIYENNYWSLQCLIVPPPSEHSRIKSAKIIEVGHTTYALNSGVTEPNRTLFLQDVQKWLPSTILKSKLRSSNPFWNANVMNENRRQSLAESRQKFAHFNSVNSETIGRKFTKFVHDVLRILPFKLLKADLRSAIPLSNNEAKSKGRSWRCLRKSSKFYWLP